MEAEARDLRRPYLLVAVNLDPFRMIDAEKGDLVEVGGLPEFFCQKEPIAALVGDEAISSNAQVLPRPAGNIASTRVRQPKRGRP